MLASMVASASSMLVYVLLVAHARRSRRRPPAASQDPRGSCITRRPRGLWVGLLAALAGSTILFTDQLAPITNQGFNAYPVHTLATLFLLLGLHEVVHVATLKAMGVPVSLYFIWKYLALAVVYKEALSKREYVLVALSPQLLITAPSMAMCLEHPLPYLVVGAVIHALSSVGDFFGVCNVIYMNAKRVRLIYSDRGIEGYIVETADGCVYYKL